MAQTEQAREAAKDDMDKKGSNSIQLRHYNERVVLDAVRRFGETSRAEIGRFAHLTPPAVANIVDALQASGYLIETGKRFGQKGQPSALYKLASDGAFSIGLHIGRRSFDAILTDFRGEARAFETHDYAHPDPNVVKRLADAAILRFKAMLPAHAQSRLVGMGVSAPYFIGGWEEALGFPADMQRAWRDFDLSDYFLANYSLPVTVENDASAAAAAELVYGAGKSHPDFIHFSLRTFVGGGLVLDGRLQTGPNGNSAAYGPFPVPYSRLSSVPKPEKPFELLMNRASIATLVRHLAANHITITRASDLAPVPAGAMPFIAEWQDDCAEALAQAIIGSISVVDVGAVIIDGPLPTSVIVGIVERVQWHFDALLPRGLVAPIILAGTIGAKGAALGASLLPMFAAFEPDPSVLMKKGNDRKPLMIGS